jgi:hypothetical protein
MNDRRKSFRLSGRGVLLAVVSAAFAQPAPANSGWGISPFKR